MSFIESFFLNFLPAALIPLIIALIVNINKKKLDFPSVDIMSDILKNKPNTQKLLMRLKHFLRMLAVVSIILAYSQPVIGTETTLQSAVVIIDHTVSMERFIITDVLNQIRSEYSVQRVYFGDKLYTDGAFRFTIQSVSFADTVTSVLNQESSYPNEGEVIVLVTDGQKPNFQKTLGGITGLNKGVVFLCHHPSNYNTYVQRVDIFPKTSQLSTKTEFTVYVGGLKGEKNERMEIFLNGIEIYSGVADNPVRFSKFMDNRLLKAGLNVGEVVLMGDDFTNDNRYYFPVVGIRKPSVSIDSPRANYLSGILSAILPEFQRVKNPDNADIVITSGLSKRSSASLIICLPENRNLFQNALRRDIGVIPEWQNKAVRGAVRSDYSVLSVIRDIEIQLAVGALSGANQTNIVAWLGESPLLYAFKNTFFFTFSLSENEGTLMYSSAVLLFLNEILTHTFYDSIFYQGSKAGVQFYSIDNRLGEPEYIAGVYKEKESGKAIVRNVESESIMEFYTMEELKKRITFASDMRWTVWDGTTSPDSQDSVSQNILSVVLMLVGMVLVLIL